MRTAPGRSCVFLLGGISAVMLIALTVARADAATFNWTVNCPTDTAVGPVTVLAITYSGTVTVAANAPASLGLLPIPLQVRIDNNAPAPGTYPGTLSCTLTFGGVTVPVTRSLSLLIFNNPTTFGITTGPTTVLVDLGPQGQVTLSAPVSNESGPLSANGSIVGFFLFNTTTVSLSEPTPTIPTLSAWAWMVLLAVLLGSALIFLRRRAA